MARRSRRTKRNLPQEPIELTVDGLSHDGRGLASLDGKVAFVDGALPGEKVTAKYLNSTSRFDELVVQSVIEASPFRVKPDCPVFGICGGCSLQHLAPAEQIRLKQQLLVDQLCQVADLKPESFEVLDPIQAESYHYRRKARLAVRYVSKKGGALVGFREKHHTFVTEMNDCPVLVKPLAALIKPLRALVNQLEANVGIPQFEVAVGDDGEDKLRVALVMRHLKPLSDRDHELLKDFAREYDCDLYLQPQGLASIHKIWPENSQADLHYLLSDHDLQLDFHPADFVQVNREINQQLIARAIELLDLRAEDRVLDLFCGLGNFTLPIARNSKTVVGVEGSEELVQRARDNARLNGLTNTEFIVTDLYQGPVNGSWHKTGFDKVLLDPPRSGALEIVASVAQLGAEKIVYISCNPETLARDTAQFIKNGYTLASAGVIDMFPHTTHVESIVELRKSRFDLKSASSTGLNNIETSQLPEG